ncbi:MAG: hypothetical protein ABIH46_11450 [Chloroflexota bacterium]
MYDVLSPLGEPAIEEGPAAPLISDLTGKTVCEVWNGSFKGNVLFPILRELLQKRYPGIKIIPYTEFPLQRVIGTTQEILGRVETAVALAKEKGCDAMITASAF